MKRVLLLNILLFFIIISATAPLMAQDKNAGSNTSATSANEDAYDPKEAERKAYPLDTQTKTAPKYSEFTLGAIVVKSGAVANIENSGTTTEITGIDIGTRSHKLLSDTLMMVPGIQISRHMKGNNQFYMRGYSMDKVALLIDGIPVTDAYGRNMDIDNIGVMNVSRIVVNRGVSSSLYGTRGVVGSINIITKKPREMYTEASAEYGQHGNYIINAVHGASPGNFYYWISATYDKSNGYEISQRLDREKREMWVWKLSRYDHYGFNLQELYESNRALRAYILDSGKWDYTEHEKYKISAKMGYEFSSNLEAGISMGYNYTKKKNSGYSSSMTSSYSEEAEVWSEPVASDALGNMSCHWPEYYNLTIAPYIYYKKNDLYIKTNFYFYEQSNRLEAFQDTFEHTRSWGQTDETATWSIWTSQSYGINIYPSYKLCSWNRLNMALSLSVDNHKKEEKAQIGASNIIQYYGSKKYKTQFIESSMLTLAIEDQINLIELVEITAGVSYDAQNLTEFKKKEDVDGGKKMIDQYMADDDSTIWGTRDSFNPVLGVLYEPIKDFLKARAAGSMKTCFPSLAAYAKTGSPDEDSPRKGGRDVKIKPERSINSSAGLEFILMDHSVNLRTDYFFSKYDDKIERIWDRNIEDHVYVNIDSAVIHGIEISVNSSLEDILNIADTRVSLSYIYTHSRNQSQNHNTEINMGDKFEHTPEHQLLLDFHADFFTDTSLAIFGQITMNQIKYTMRELPETDSEFSTDYFYEQKLHNPVMINVKVSQKIMERFSIYIMCKNIFDDYNADPLNPGPGRMWYVCGKAKL